MIQLQPQQQEHVARLVNILKHHKCALDLSVMGAGKSYSSAYLSLLPELGFAGVVVICPVSVQAKWNMIAAEHGVPLIRCMSYQTLRAARGRQPAHGLLYRIDEPMEIKGRSVNKVQFAPTPQLEQAARDGLLVVVDEFQHLKNISAQFEAVRTLVRAVRSTDNSRCLFLSGSPFDRTEHAVALLKTLGIMQSDVLTQFDLPTRSHVWIGAQEVVQECMQMNDARTQQIVQSWQYCSPTLMTYELFQKVVKVALHSTMPHPRLDCTISKYNAFYDITDRRHLPQLRAGIRALERVVGYDPLRNTVNFATAGGGANTMGALTLALKAIERAKVPTLAKITNMHLHSRPNLKVVLCVNYTDSILELTQALADFNPLVLDGHVPQTHRAGIIDKFQQSDLTKRLLIANTLVCSTGIDLDDKRGSLPRLCIVSPNYATLTIHQLGHRFLRMDTKGSSELHMFYIKNAAELPVITALAKKGGVMKDTTEQQVQAGVIFPGDYPHKDVSLETMADGDRQSRALEGFRQAVAESIEPGGRLYDEARRRFESASF